MADYKEQSQYWTPVMTHFMLLEMISSILDIPDLETPLIADVAAHYFKDRPGFEAMARSFTKEYATGQRPSDEELLALKL